jgi:hypothetical protein
LKPLTPVTGNNINKVSNAQIAHSVSHQLKLGISGQKLFYLVCDKNSKQIATGEKYISDSKTLQDLLDRDDVLSGIYSKTQLMVIAPKYVLVPEQFARHDHEYSFYKLSNKSHPEERLFRDHNLEQKEIQYSGNRTLLRLIQQKYPNIEKHHVTTVFHRQAEALKGECPDLLQLSIQDNFMYLTVSQNGTVLLSNAYHISNSEDIFYFSMLAMEQLKLEPSTTRIHLYNSSFKEQSLSNLFQNYFASTSSDTLIDEPFIEIWNSCE